MPDLEYHVGSYMFQEDPSACITFMERTALGKITRDRRVRGLLREWIGNSRHLWMWDFKGVASELHKEGFRNIRRAHFGDSADWRFFDVEEAGQWEDSLGVECVV